MRLGFNQRESMQQGNRRLRILCISPLFAPLANAEAFCSAKLVSALREAGADVTVLTCSNVLTERPVLDDSFLWNDLRGTQTDVVVPRVRRKWQSIWTALRYQTAIYSRWVAAVVKKAQALHQERNFDFVYSRSLPMCGHIAGYWCAKTLSLPWIANIDDPWEAQFMPGIAFPNISGLHAATYRFWLKKTLRTADLVTYPCPRLQRFHAEVSGIGHDAAIIPHVGSAHENTNMQQGMFHLVHAGKLGASENPQRPVRSLLIALKNFLDENAAARSLTRLTLVGPDDEATSKVVCELGLQSIVVSTGRASYEESLQHIASATVCVVLEAVIEEGIFFPSKLVDYIAAGKPVLAISPERGTVADLAASKRSIVRVDQRDPAIIKSAIAGLYEEFRHSRLASRVPDSTLRNQFSSRVVAKQFFSAIETKLPSRRCAPQPTGLALVASEVK